MAENEAAKSKKFTLEELYSTEEVHVRIDKLAIDVVKYYKGKKPLFVACMKGAIPFLSKLMFAIAEHDPDFQPEVDYMIVSTYKDGTAVGEPRIVLDLAPDVAVKDRPVVIVDDLRHTGTTAKFLDGHLRNRGATEVDYIALVIRDIETTLYPDVTFCAFSTVEERWFTGMGMDNAPVQKEMNRWMGSVAIVNFADE